MSDKPNRRPGSGFIRIREPLPALSIILLVLMICPLGMIFARALVNNGRLDLLNAPGIIFQKENLSTILNTLALGFSVVIGSTFIALPLAFLVCRTQIVKSKWLDVVLMIPFMTPPFIASMGWILFTQKNGLFQQIFPFTGSFSEGFFSFGGLVLVMSLHVFPFMYTILKNALLNIGSGMEESAAVSGGAFWYRIRKITLPLLTGNYAIGALLVFVKTLSEYGTPATLGHRIGLTVFTTAIYRYATISPIDFGRSASLSGALIAICLGAWFLQNYITVRKTYRLVGGKGLRRNISHLKGLPLLAAWAVLALVIIVAIGIPYFSVFCTSIIKLRGYGLAAGNFTIQHYFELFAERKARGAFITSIVLAVSAASIAAVLGTALASAFHYSKLKVRKVLEAVSLSPEMLPSIVFVIGIMLFWNGIYKVLPLYNTIGIMILAYVTLFLPYTIQYVNSAFSQIGESLIQAGRSLGGSSSYVFRRVTLPLLARGVIAGWIMTFIISFRELVTASLISPPNTLVISTYITREFEQGSVSLGMSMAMICVVFTTAALILLNRFISSHN